VARWITAAVEGEVDAAVVERLADHSGVSVSEIYGKNGKAALKQRLSNYNNAAQFAPWLVLVDLDNDFSCAPDLVVSWLPNPARQMRFRVAVRQVEAWLLADRERIAGFLGVRKSQVPSSPEDLTDAKRALIDLARRSRRRDIRVDMVPRPSSGRKVGPAYVSRIIEYVYEAWRPRVAASNAASLAKCLRRLRAI